MMEWISKCRNRISNEMKQNLRHSSIAAIKTYIKIPIGMLGIKVQKSKCRDQTSNEELKKPLCNSMHGQISNFE